MILLSLLTASYRRASAQRCGAVLNLHVVDGDVVAELVELGAGSLAYSAGYDTPDEPIARQATVKQRPVFVNPPGRTQDLGPCP